jgi:2-polyprenyl-6-methoxyphenol hydroxylase-like FAD-dependent oxidoreductase
MDGAHGTVKLQTDCCIAGGGPAGMMLGFLLARAGVDVVVMEKHSDFLRDFRGDTVHPSTLDLMHELGLLDEFLRRPHQELSQLKALVGNEEFIMADFSGLSTHCKFIVLMPQWDFLNFVAEKAKSYPAFHLCMDTEVTGLIEESDRIAGVHAKTPQGELEIRSKLVVGADGRHSTVRDRSGPEVEDIGSPMDVLWMRVPKRPTDSDITFHFDRGKLLVLLDRGDYWQLGLVIRKGGAEEMRQKGVEAVRTGILELAPFLEDRVGELRSWDDVHLLTVKVDRLQKWWRPGLLCIGDAAHAMSPIGGVGINLAIQDAVATANILAGSFKKLDGPTDCLAAVQHRRTFPTRLTQAMQVAIQNNVIAKVLASSEELRPPWFLHILEPATRPLRSHFIGVGVRAEHIRTVDVNAR